jgi:hypothetical protein
MQPTWRRRGMHIGLWWEGQNEKDYYENFGVVVRDNIKMDLIQRG